VVRVEARRLRRDLDSYYMNAGDHDSVRISIPKGAYVPNFETVGPPDTSVADIAHRSKQAGRYGQTERKGGARTSKSRAPAFSLRQAIGASFMVLFVVTAIFWFSAVETTKRDSLEAPGELSVRIIPFQALDSAEETQYLAAGISQDLISDLIRFPGLRLYSNSAGIAAGIDEPPYPGSNRVEVTYVVSGSVRVDSAQAHVVAQMANASTNEIVWTEAYDPFLNPDEMIQLEKDLAGDIATKLGQPYGYLHTDVEDHLSTSEVSNMQSYLCVQRAFHYRRNFSEEQFGPILECLEQAVKSDPNYSDAWAMLGWLHLDAGRFDFFGPERMEDEYATALECASHAESLEPDNTMALKALSSIHHYMGHFDESERFARKAVELNPYDPDTLAQLGWRLAIRGHFQEGIPILRKAIDRTVNPPGWYFHLVAVELYLAGEYEEMLSVSQRSALDGSEFSQVLIAIASGALGDREGAQQAFSRLPEATYTARNFGDFLRRHGATLDITSELETGLKRAKTLAVNRSG